MSQDTLLSYRDARPNLLKVGDEVEIRHHPSLKGDDIVIKATIVATDHPYYYIDTEMQRHIRIHRKYLQQCL